MDSCCSKAPFLQPPGFGPLCLISIPYQKCTGTDLLACEPDALSSSSAHPPQGSISGSFPLSSTPGKLIIFSLYFSWGAIFMVILIVKVELVKENTFFFPVALIFQRLKWVNIPREPPVVNCSNLSLFYKSGYGIFYLQLYIFINSWINTIFYRLYKLLHASRGSAKWIITSFMSQQTGVSVTVQFASIVFWYMAS